MGHRSGGAGLPFAATGAALFHRTPSSAAFGLVFIGLVMHVTLAFAWSAAFAWIAQRWNGRDALVAVAIALAQFAAAWMAAAATGTGLASVLSLGDRIILAVVMAGSLLLGKRFTRLISPIA